MTTKHTAGPWIALPEECDKPYIRVRGTQLGGRYKVANVLTPVYDGVNQREAEETRANARLIAAAPELLDLLSALECDINTLVYCYERKPDNFGRAVVFAKADAERARAAIAKARGEQQ